MQEKELGPLVDLKHRSLLRRSIVLAVVELEVVLVRSCEGVVVALMGCEIQGRMMKIALVLRLGGEGWRIPGTLCLEHLKY